MTATFAVSAGATAIFNPISSQLANLPDGAGTIAALIQASASSPPVGDMCGLTDGTGSQTFVNFYHSLSFDNQGHNEPDDDDGLVMNNPGSGTNLTLPSTHWWLFAFSWPAGAAHLENISWVDLSVGTWTHTTTDINNGGNRVGPTTTAGQWNIGYGGDKSAATNIALCGAWAGAQLSSTNIESLLTNMKTSDWYQNAGGNPTTLVECTSLTPTDIGANPSTFDKVIGTIALTGGIPTNGTTSWTFDGQGSVGPTQVLLPGSDITTTGWTPSTGSTLFGVLDDGSDADWASGTLS